jgi:hypothetical protein
MKRLLAVLLAIAILGTLVLGTARFLLGRHALRRADAQARELAELLHGPLLPGEPEKKGTVWEVTLLRPIQGVTTFRVVGVDEPDTDLVRMSVLKPDGGVLLCWGIGVGTPTEVRFLEALRSDPVVCEALGRNDKASPREAFLAVFGTMKRLLPDSFSTPVAMESGEEEDLRNHLDAVLVAESARDDVRFTEESQSFVVMIGVNNLALDEEPGAFKRLAGRIGDLFDITPLTEWASRERKRPPTVAFPKGFLSLQISLCEGMVAPCRIIRGEGEYMTTIAIDVEASTRLAASLRGLFAKHRPETFGIHGDPHPFRFPAGQYAYVKVATPHQTETRHFPLSNARFHEFLIDLLRLLSAPPAA